ncbi:MAG: hypothetical protein J2P48_18300 [Alphaproteobacteria bacterium]|nr:hypothetical protein [Alphaproteobacteria bacterium]
MRVVAIGVFATGTANGQETPSPEEGSSLDIDVMARQLDAARTEIQPRLRDQLRCDRNPAEGRQSGFESVIDAQARGARRIPPGRSTSADHNIA